MSSPSWKLVNKATGEILVYSDAPLNVGTLSESGVIEATYSSENAQWLEIDTALITATTNQKGQIIAQMQGLEVAQHRSVREYLLAETDEDRATAKARLSEYESQIKSLREQYQALESSSTSTDATTGTAAGSSADRTAASS